MEVLYVYDHCPYCVKARMIFGLKKRPLELKILLNDDEATPISMIGQKMVPILQEGAHYMGESMDIVAKIDHIDQKPILVGELNPEIQAWLSATGKYVSKLLYPRYTKAGLEEFATQSAHDYFTAKKEAMVGSFAALLEQTLELLAKLNQDLQSLEPLIQSDKACNGVLSTDDIHLFALLRCISIIEGVIYPPKVNSYRQTMAKEANIPLFKAS